MTDDTDTDMDKAWENTVIMRKLIAELRAGASYDRIGILVLQAYWLGKGMSIEEIIERTESKPKTKLTIVR